MEIKIEINNCNECPYNRKVRKRTYAGWEEIYRWECKKMNDKIIAGCIELDNIKYVEFPDWCPCLLNKIK